MTQERREMKFNVVDIGALAISFIEAREEKKAANAERRRLAATLGSCDGCETDEGPCYHNPKGEQCEICTAKRPAQLAFWKASTKAATALRVLSQAVKRRAQDLKND